MRKKEKHLVLSFFTTTQAMGAERILKERGIRGRIIPLPGEISAECGLAWCSPIEEKEKIEKLTGEGKLWIDSMTELFLYVTDNGKGGEKDGKKN